MEVGRRAMATPTRSAVQTKLTDAYRGAKRAPGVENLKGGRRGEVVNKEPVGCHGSGNEAAGKQVEAAANRFEVAAKEFVGAARLWRAIDVTEPGASSLEAQRPGGGVSLRKVKMELLSPASCVTNGSVFGDPSGGAADVNAGMRCVDAEPCEMESVAETQVGGDALQSRGDALQSSVSPVTGLVEVRDGTIVERAKRAVTPASSDGSTVEVPVAVTVTAGSSPSVQKVSGPVKVEAVEREEKLITARDMFGGLGEEGLSACLQRKVEGPARDGSPKKLMTALDMFPGEVHKVEVVDVGRGEMTKVAAPVRSGSVHVKSEPVDDSREGSSLKELEGVALRNEVFRVRRTAVKQGLVSSTPECPSVGLVRCGENQASEESSETEHSSSSSEDGDETEYLPIEMTKVDAPVRSGLIHVKSEPVDDSGAGSSLKEAERVALRNEVSRVRRTAVKQELVSSSPECPSVGLVPCGENQASEESSETEHSSSGSEDSDDTEYFPIEVDDGAEETIGLLSRRSQRTFPIEVDDGAEEIIGMLSRRSQRTDRAHERRKEKEMKNRNSNPGRRIQGGRIYDSSLGKTCHWCRQKTVEHHVKCRECTIHYCGACLMNRNGENIMEELAEGVRWLCPKCRNGCGPGCENCCNCGPCRKASGKAPTGQLIREARNAGFLNAHDYLVHLETDETPEAIAQRKVGRDWTNCGRFEWKDTSENSEARDEDSTSEGTEEFTLNEETSTQLHEGKIGMKVVKRFVQSQLKRKRGAMRGAIPAKRSSVEASSSVRHRDVKNIIARLRAPAEKIAKRKENEVEAASRRVGQKFEEGSALRFLQEDVTALRNQSSGMRIKREFVEVNVGGSDVEDTGLAKRRKLEGFSGERRNGLLSELMPPRSTLPDPFSRVKCKVEPTTLSEENPSIVGVENSNEAGPRRKSTSDADTPAGQARSSKDCVSESELTLKMRGSGFLDGAKIGFNNAASQLFEQRGLECPSDPQGTEYRTKLKFALAQPFDARELEMLEESARCRKPVQKLRQMRGRIVDVVTEDEGFSYLDHHQDFALRLEEAQSPPVKLALLRGFFFWLQHSCMEGAFRPWPGALTESRPQSGDCIETEGPDCQVTAVVLQLDEGKDALRPEESNEADCSMKHKHAKLVQKPLEITNEVGRTEMTSNPLRPSTMTQALIPFQVKKNSVQPVKLPKMKGQVKVQPGLNYRVVLCLPAPALCKK